MLRFSRNNNLGLGAMVTPMIGGKKEKLHMSIPRIHPTHKLDLYKFVDDSTQLTQSKLIWGL